MNRTKPKLWLLLFAVSLFSCKQPISKYHYAITDFKTTLQPYLTDIVNKGIVGYADSSLHFLANNASNNELQQLTLAESPLLRAAALRMLLRQPSVNDFLIIMPHLDDTALLATNAGEFGVYYYTVSDYMLQYANWKNEDEQYKTVDKIIVEHNYLQSAYTILYDMPAKEKYYPYIKKMAQRNASFESIEFALYGLAKYKKKDDIPLIKKTLLSGYNPMDMTRISFKLMKMYPDDAYLDVLERYAKHHLFWNIHNHEIGDPATDFFETVASYKNERSAAILKSLVQRNPFVYGSQYSSHFKDRLLESILGNQCPAYKTLVKEITPMLSDFAKKQPIPQPDTSTYIPPLGLTYWSHYHAKITPDPPLPY